MLGTPFTIWANTELQKSDYNISEVGYTYRKAEEIAEKCKFYISNCNVMNEIMQWQSIPAAAEKGHNLSCLTMSWKHPAAKQSQPL